MRMGKEYGNGAGQEKHQRPTHPPIKTPVANQQPRGVGKTKSQIIDLKMFIKFGNKEKCFERPVSADRSFESLIVFGCAFYSWRVALAGGGVGRTAQRNADASLSKHCTKKVGTIIHENWFNDLGI